MNHRILDPRTIQLGVATHQRWVTVPSFIVTISIVVVFRVLTVEPLVLPGWRRIELPGKSVTADRAPADGSRMLEVGVAAETREADLDAAAAARLSELRRRCPGYFGRDRSAVHKGRLA